MIVPLAFRPAPLPDEEEIARISSAKSSLGNYRPKVNKP
jgi:hypothetical protein